MDGPIIGPPEAFARLADLNPLNKALPPKPPGASAASSSTASVSFVLLRPLAVKGQLVSDICTRFEKRGLELAAMRMLKPGREIVEKHFASVADKDAAKLVSALAPGPCIAMLWSGPNALPVTHLLVGDDDPLKALPGTIRGDLSRVPSTKDETADRLIELAADAADVERLKELWFEKGDLALNATSLAVAPAPSLIAQHDAALGSAAGKSAPLPLLPPKPDCGEYYISTAINYANGPPHMGHAYEAIAADVIARYHRAYGRSVFFLTGADEHGQKIADTAAGKDPPMKPIELCDLNVKLFQQLDHDLNCEYDGYVRTTSDKHKVIARKLWQKCEQNGGVYAGTYVGWYVRRAIHTGVPCTTVAPIPPPPSPP